MYTRIIKSQLEYWLKTDKVLILYGARQVGKTTLAKEIAANYDSNYTYIDCEDFGVQDILNSGSIEKLKRFVMGVKIIIFDEAQKVENIGIALKLLHDHVPELKIIATGSSSFELANKVSEPLTGRNIKFTLYPLSLGEIGQKENMFSISNQLDIYLCYGSYPGVMGQPDNISQALLRTLAVDYIYRDIFDLVEVRKPVIFRDLMKTLAYLIGQTVTYSDIAKKINTDKTTVERYIDLLEKSFIIKILRPLHRSHIREIIHPFKVYFYDLGIRNAIISEFKPINQRDGFEVGALWENFCIIERIKKNEYGNPEKEDEKFGIFKQYYFWRTKESTPKEYDLIEEKDGKFDVFEMKRSEKKEGTVKKYNVFFETYPKSELNVIHGGNWDEWLV
jgi:uncharacterized protein